VKAQELCRRYGISDATFNKYKAKFGGMNVSYAKKVRAFEDENNRLKRMLADAMLDNAALRELATKKLLTARPCPPLVRGQWSSMSKDGLCRT
jgi:putative transposase